MTGIRIIQSQSELDREVLSPAYDCVLCFVFTAVENSELYLDGMANYLHGLKSDQTSEDQWYYSDEVLIKMRKKVRALCYRACVENENSRSLFLITAIANKKYPGATIYEYKDGILVSDDSSIHDPPSVEHITDRRDLFCCK